MMIESSDVAQQISSLMLDVSAKINDSMFLVRDRCTNQEFEQYRTVCAKVLGYLLIDILNPIYAAHPEMKPKELEK
jgi:hypothetical protein